MSNSEQQPIVYQTIIFVNVTQPPPTKTFCWMSFIVKASVLSLPWLLDHVYQAWPALIS